MVLANCLPYPLRFHNPDMKRHLTGSHNVQISSFEESTLIPIKINLDFRKLSLSKSICSDFSFYCYLLIHLYMILLILHIWVAALHMDVKVDIMDMKHQKMYQCTNFRYKIDHFCKSGCAKFHVRILFQAKILNYVHYALRMIALYQHQKIPTHDEKRKKTHQNSKEGELLHIVIIVSYIS